MAAEHDHVEHDSGGSATGWRPRRSDAYDEAWTRRRLLDHSWVRATPEELDELGEAIDAVVTEFRASHHEPRPGGRAVTSSPTVSSKP